MKTDMLWRRSAAAVLSLLLCLSLSFPALAAKHTEEPAPEDPVYRLTLTLRTAEDLLGQLVRLCELDDDHFDESKVEIAIYNDGDSEDTKALLLKNLREIGVRASEWQKAMKNEIARILDESIQTWDDVAEATIKFEDKGWGSEAMFDDELAAMIPNGSRVIIASDSGQELVADESNRDTIERYIDDSVVQKYVAGSDVVFII